MPFKTPFWWYPNRLTPWRRRSAAVVSLILGPFAALYGLLAAWQQRRSHPGRVSCPVISVGNLTMGGAGKTPLVLALCEGLRAQGFTPHVVMRGYGGQRTLSTRVEPHQHTAADVGDEALYLALKAQHVWVGRNRLQSARAAIANGGNVVIMDDGHQDRTLHKDFRILVMDAQARLGNGRVFPAGPLRQQQTPEAWAAEQLVVIGEAPEKGNDDCPSTLPIARILPTFVAPHQVTPHKNDAPPPVLDRNDPVVAFAGLGLPDKFYTALQRAGYSIARTHSFPDHHRFRTHELNALEKDAQRHNAALVTTAKDFVRLPPEFQTKVFVADVRISRTQCAEIIKNFNTFLCVFSHRSCMNTKNEL